MRKSIVILAFVLVAQAVMATELQTVDPFYVYTEAHSPLNHFIPSGWMGDAKALKYSDSAFEAHEGKTAIKVTYTPSDKDENHWAGIYWQYPLNDWGNKPALFNMNGYSRVTFWAKSGTKNPLTINEVKVGGIAGENPDSATVSLTDVMVSPKWAKFTLDLKGNELSSIIGGFCIAMNADSNPDGFTLLLDDIRYEK
jgi:hypothetical protein